MHSSHNSLEWNCCRIQSNKQNVLLAPLESKMVDCFIHNQSHSSQLKKCQEKHLKLDNEIQEEILRKKVVIQFRFGYFPDWSALDSFFCTTVNCSNSNFSNIFQSTWKIIEIRSTLKNVKKFWVIQTIRFYEIWNILERIFLQSSSFCKN